MEATHNMIGYIEGILDINQVTGGNLAYISGMFLDPEKLEILHERT